MHNKRFLTLTLAILLIVTLPQIQNTAKAATTIFINEIHYDNSGTDTGEAVEIIAPAGTDLAGWSIVFYNGSGGASYGTKALSGTVSDQCDGYGTISFTHSGIQNGPDGIALVDDTNAVIQFLSYEGSFTATSGAAIGLTSTDVGVSETSSTPIGDSLQLAGMGSMYSDFSWQPPATSSFGDCNPGQNFSGVARNIIINEVDYDQVGGDNAEFIELKNNSAGTVSLNGYTLELVNGFDDLIYETITLPNVLIPADGYYLLCRANPQITNCDWIGAFSSIQNGAPDAVGLRLDGILVDVLSYEGSVPGYTEGAGLVTGDSNLTGGISVSRYPDGGDTDDNNTDFSVRCITPGIANSSVSSGCTANFTENCSISASTDIAITSATLNFTTLGDPAITCIRVTHFNYNHPNATTAIQTNAFWHIEATPTDAGSITSFDYSLTLPYSSPQDPEDKICRWLEGSGAGYGWDCAANGYETDGITRSGLNGFSDWAIGDNVGPTAVSLQSFAGNNHNSTLIVLIVMVLVLMGGTAVLRYRKQI